MSTASDPPVARVCLLEFPRRDLSEQLGELDPRPVQVLGIDVIGTPAGRRLRDRGVVPAEVADAPARQEIDVAFPARIVDKRTVRARHLDVFRLGLAPEVFAIELAEIHAGRACMNDARRRLPRLGQQTRRRAPAPDAFKIRE